MKLPSWHFLKISPRIFEWVKILFFDTVQYRDFESNFRFVLANQYFIQCTEYAPSELGLIRWCIDGFNGLWTILGLFYV